MIWSLLVALLLAPPVDPAADQGTPFEYYAATETRLVPFAATPSSPRAPVDAGFRVLADGQVASPRGQFVIYLDDPPRPLAGRAKRWLRPDLPVLQLTARAGDAQLQVQMLAGTPATSPEGVAMVRLSARATARSRLVVTAGWVPHPGHSARWPAHDLSARYGFADGAVWRDGRLLYQFPLLPTPTRLAAPEVTYAEPFTLREVLALRETPVGLVRYELALGPGQASQLVFRVPRADLEYGHALPLLRQADFDEALLQASREWSAWHGSQPTVTVPEEKVAAAYLAAQRRLRAWGAPPLRRSALSERLLAARLCRGLVMTRGRDGRRLGSLLLTAARGRLLLGVGRQREAAEALYAVLLHSAATHEFTDAVPVEWLHRERLDAWGIPFDRAVAAEFIGLVEEMLVRQAGDRLVLGAAMPPSWLTGHTPVTVDRMLLPIGQVHLAVTAGHDTITYRWSGDLAAVRRVEVVVPWYLAGARAEQAGRPLAVEQGVVSCAPTAGPLVLRGGNRPLPAEPTYAATIAAYRRAYQARFEAFRDAGGTLANPALPWLPLAERRAHFEELYGGS